MKLDTLDALLKKYHLRMDWNPQNCEDSVIFMKDDLRCVNSQLICADGGVATWVIAFAVEEKERKHVLFNGCWCTWEELFKLFKLYQAEAGDYMPVKPSFTTKVKSSKGESVQLDNKLRDAETINGIYHSIITFPSKLIRKIKKLLDK